MPEKESPANGKAGDKEQTQNPTEQGPADVEVGQDDNQGLPIHLSQNKDNQRDGDKTPEKNFKSARRQKLMRSFSTTSGRRSTWVWIAPIYSPTMPMKKSWTEEKRNRPITIGA